MGACGSVILQKTRHKNIVLLNLSLTCKINNRSSQYLNPGCKVLLSRLLTQCANGNSGFFFSKSRFLNFRRLNDCKSFVSPNKHQCVSLLHAEFSSQ